MTTNKGIRYSKLLWITHILIYLNRPYLIMNIHQKSSVHSAITTLSLKHMDSTQTMSKIYPGQLQISTKNKLPKHKLSPRAHTLPILLKLVITFLTQVQTVTVVSIQKQLDITRSVLAASIAVDNVACGFAVPFIELVVLPVLDKWKWVGNISRHTCEL